MRTLLEISLCVNFVYNEDMSKKLYRSEENKIIFGIFGGLGEYWDIDPVFIRLVAIFLLFMTGFAPMFIGYLIAFFIVPDKPKRKTSKKRSTSKK